MKPETNPSAAGAHLAPQYTNAVGTKFYADGSLRRFPGNTVVSMVEPDTEIHDWLQTTTDAVDELRGPELAMLPASSWHMTVFELLLDEVRDTDHWSRFISPDAPLAVVDRFMQDAVASLEPPRSIAMRPEMIALRSGLTLRLLPANPTVHNDLIQYRERLADVTGVRFPDHDTYRYHISMAYLIYEPEQEQRRALAQVAATAERALEKVAEIVLPAPTVRFFVDMGSYHLDPAGR